MNTDQYKSLPYRPINPTVVSRNIFFALLILLLSSTSCGARADETAAATSTAEVDTPTPAPTNPSPPSDTPLPAPVQPTAVPVEGTTSTQVNVRAEPSTAASVLGIIPANTKVEITGKDPAGNWWQILYPQSQAGKGWVTSQYVTTTNGTTVPVLGDNHSTDPGSGNVAIVQQQINVRSGPGTGFNSVGIVNARDVLRLVGKDANGAWLQIEFPSGPEGKGWVNAAFVQSKGVKNLDRKSVV